MPSTPDGDPKPKAQRNFTDSDSRIMESNSSFLQAYNCQLAVDEERQVIVAHAVTNQSPDAEHLMPILEQVVDNCGTAPATSTADAGYWRRGHLDEAEALTPSAPPKAEPRTDRDAIGTMPERERTVLGLYYFESLTLAQIGEVLGVSESRVCQIHTKAILQLRSRMDASGQSPV